MKQKIFFQQYMILSTDVYHNDQKIITKCYINCEMIANFLSQMLIQTLNLNKKNHEKNITKSKL